jgi:hypothetical protein
VGSPWPFANSGIDFTPYYAMNPIELEDNPAKNEQMVAIDLLKLLGSNLEGDLGQ